MKQKISLQLLCVVFSSALVFSSCIKNPPCDCDSGNKPTVDVFATGLNNPRGLKFGPDGYLYVAEGGVGGTNSTVGKCMQIPAPLGPALGSTTGGRISRINFSGIRNTVVDNLPTTVNQFGDVSGVADVVFVGNTLYALETGAGCSHGVPSIPNGIYKINTNGSNTMLANLSDWVQTHPVAHPEEDDFEPDGDFYSMINVDGNFYVVEANHGEVDKITPDGDISRVVDVSATQGHIVPTVITHHKGEYYLGNLDTFPAPPGASQIFKVSASGQLTSWATGFNMILGLAFDKHDQLYVLESTAGFPFPTAGAGKIVRVSPTGAKEEIVSGLTFPTGLTYGEDGNLYVSNNGYGPTSIGGGQVLRVNLKDCECDCDQKMVVK